MVLGLPDLKGRKEILKVHAKTRIFSSEANLEIIAQRTPGFSGADLANIINEAALLAGRENKEKIETERRRDLFRRSKTENHFFI